MESCPQIATIITAVAAAAADSSMCLTGTRFELTFMWEEIANEENELEGKQANQLDRQAADVQEDTKRRTRVSHHRRD